MAKQIHTIDYTTNELDALLEKAEKRPFVIWHDESAGVYRFFPDESKKDLWVDAYTSGNMTPEVAEYEFASPITAPAPYVININDVTDNQYVLEGSKGTTLGFIFSTVDGKGSEVQESVDVYYTFRSPSGTKTASAIYNSGTTVSLNIDEYLSLGTNNITILVRGRSTGATKTVVATYRVIRLNLTSTFNIATPIEMNTDFEVTYSIEGESNKIVEFCIDGEVKYTADISSLETQATKVQKILNYDGRLEPGMHTLQMKAKVMAGNNQFFSNLLYYEFQIKGSSDTRTLISEIFPSTQDYFTGAFPGLYGEQYVVKKINWAYYSSNPLLQSATVQWRLYTEGGDETTLATRTADVVDAEIGTPPEPLSFMPTEYGDYELQALIIDPATGLPMKDSQGNVIIFGNYTISVIQNTNGILEATEGLSMKLSGLGRDNSEPDTTRNSWADRGHACTFHNMPFNHIAGYLDNAVVFNDGAYGVIDMKPFSSDVNPTIRNGAVFEIDFETFDIDDEDAVLVQIGGPSNPKLVITASKAVLTTSSGKETIAQFKSDERVKLCFVIYPRDTSDYKGKTMLYINGVMSNVINYEISDTYNIGGPNSGDVGKIIVGNSAGLAGIKIYYIRTYSQFISMYNELNNFFIDSGEDLTRLVTRNDIYASNTKVLDIDKLSSAITTVKVTGPLQDIIGTGGKGQVFCQMEITSPFDSNINIHCDQAQFGNAGQSTLDKPIPSFHVKLDKGSNVCYDRDNNIIPKNRWAFRAGNVPEKKFRLQANFMDSSNAHNGAFFRMINDVYPNVKVNVDDDEHEKYVLRMPAEEYALSEYSDEMARVHGADPSGNNWKFPYNMHMVPDSIPCIVVYRATKNDDYTFLGQYVIMEEKKANYANGMHSIYDGLDSDGNPDPFGFNSSKSENRLWDNSNCHQYELLTSTDVETLFLDDSEFDEHQVNTFELVYPDEDDAGTDVEAEWDKFKTDFLGILCEMVTETTGADGNPVYTGNQTQFNNFYNNGKVVNGKTIKLDRWHFAAYYILVLRNCCSDSTARNMEITTYDGVTWLPKWWDVDMQCGLSQTNRCDLLPGMDRNSIIPGSDNVYAISGRIDNENGYKSSWLWDGLENCPQFQEDVLTMEDALYKAGWTYNNMTKIQDEEFVDAWSQALYNESSITKYLNTNDLVSLQGDRTSHRHWFLKTSYDHWDGVHASGAYGQNYIAVRTLAPEGGVIKVVPGKDSYLGWGTSISNDEIGVFVEKNVQHIFTISRTLQYNNPLHIFGASNLQSVDLSDIATTLAADLYVASVYDSIVGTLLKDLIVGTEMVEEDDEDEGYHYIDFNRNSSFSGFSDGADKLTRLETLSIRGLLGWRNVAMSAMGSLKKFYAAGSSLQTFYPANSTQFEEVELPTSVNAITMVNCNLTDENDNCLINWFETIFTEGGYTLLSFEPSDWETKYTTYYTKEGNNYIHVTGSSAPDFEENTYYSYNETTPSAVKETTVSTNLVYLSFEGMGYDKGTQKLIVDWVNAHEDAGTDFNTLSLYYKNVHWIDIDIDTLKLIAKIPTTRALPPDAQGIRRPGQLTGYIKINGTITSQDIVELKEAFGDDVFSSTPGSLSLDANAGFVLGAPDSIVAGNAVTITGVTFPTSQSGDTVTYTLGTGTGTDFVPFTLGTDSDGNQIYTNQNVTLYRNTGRLVVAETSDDTHDVTVRGANSTSHKDAVISIQKRVYPTSVNLDLTSSGSGDSSVTYNEDLDEWYVVDSSNLGMYITLDVVLNPSNITGTVSSHSWTISDDLEEYVFVNGSNVDRIVLRIPVCPEDVARGTVTYSRTYVEGTIVSKTLNFALKSPKIAILASVNSVLQQNMFDADIANSETYTYDTELWNVNDSVFEDNVNVQGSQLKHLAELDRFTNITEMDVSKCTLLGSLSTQQLLEDNEYHYVDVIPARDIDLTLDLTSVDLRNTQVRGINLKEGSSLEEIYYSDYTTEVKLIDQDNLEEVDLTMVDDDCNVIIDDCDNLETLNI